MSICYLCGKILVDRPNDFHKSHTQYTKCAIKHKEHIIHNQILCIASKGGSSPPYLTVEK